MMRRGRCVTHLIAVDIDTVLGMIPVSWFMSNRSCLHRTPDSDISSHPCTQIAHAHRRDARYTQRRQQLYATLHTPLPALTSVTTPQTAQQESCPTVSCCERPTSCGYNRAYTHTSNHNNTTTSPELAHDQPTHAATQRPQHNSRNTTAVLPRHSRKRGTRIERAANRPAQQVAIQLHHSVHAQPTSQSLTH